MRIYNLELIDAVVMKDIGAVRKLLDGGADPNGRDTEHGDPALYYSCSDKTLQIPRLLIARGADVNSTNDNGRTALMAGCHGPLDLVRLLLDNGADISMGDVDGTTALHCAVYGADPEIIKVLVEAGADIVARDYADMTPLDLAEALGMLKIVEILRSAAN